MKQERGGRSPGGGGMKQEDRGAAVSTGWGDSNAMQVDSPPMDGDHNNHYRGDRGGRGRGRGRGGDSRSNYYRRDDEGHRRPYSNRNNRYDDDNNDDHGNHRDYNQSAAAASSGADAGGWGGGQSEAYKRPRRDDDGGYSRPADTAGDASNSGGW